MANKSSLVEETRKANKAEQKKYAKLPLRTRVKIELISAAAAIVSGGLILVLLYLIFRIANPFVTALVSVTVGIFVWTLTKNRLLRRGSR